MDKLSNIDKNFKVETDIKRDNLHFFDAQDPVFSLHGVFFNGKGYVRLPDDVAKATSHGVHVLSKCTPGGRLRFKTSSKYIAIKMTCPEIMRHNRTAMSGLCGFDMFSGNRYITTFIPPLDAKDGYELIYDFSNEELRDITIHFPLYNEVSSLRIGLDKNSEILPPEPYAVELPVVYYGSSITQGGCASRPGSAYQNLLSIFLNIDHINLGFSGNAKGEQIMADYIAGLKMSAFVMDYDYNAPTPMHLKETHEPFFRTVREANPTLPILIMSRPRHYLSDEDVIRRDIVRQTYENAIANGDKNVYYIDGSTLMNDEIRDLGTVDGTHPTDLGFFSMAKRIEPVLKEMLSLR